MLSMKPFLPLLTLWYSIWLAFRPENYIYVSNFSFSCSRGGEKKKFRETAIIFKTLNERESSSFHRRST